MWIEVILRARAIYLLIYTFMSELSAYHYTFMRELQRPFHTFMRESSLDEEIGASYKHNAQRYRRPQEKRTPKCNVSTAG